MNNLSSRASSSSSKCKTIESDEHDHGQRPPPMPSGKTLIEMCEVRQIVASAKKREDEFVLIIPNRQVE
jgi:hypothetical protein